MTTLTDTYLGIDVSCATDFDPNIRPVSGPVLVLQAIVRRWLTPRGIFPWWPEYGTDLRQFLLSKAPAQRIVAAAIAEAEKDERVEYISIGIEQSADGREIMLSAEAQVVGEEDAQFSFVLAISDAKQVISEVVLSEAV